MSIINLLGILKWGIYESRLKYQRDKNSLIYEAELKAIKKGIEKGKLQNARLMKENGIEIKLISKITGLSLYEIEKL